MPGAGAMTDDRACPVCGGGLHPSGESCSLETILELWRPVSFSDAVAAEHKAQADATRLFVCEGCGLEIFLPQIIGTPSFYRELMRPVGPVDKTTSYYEDTKWDFVEAQREVRDCASILEFGCGPGHFLMLSSAKNRRVVGVEYNETAIMAARKQGLEVFSADAVPSGLGSSFDGVFTFHVLEHVAAPMAFLTELVKYARPGGVICVSVPNQEGPISNIDPNPMNLPPHHATRWRRSTFEAAAQRLGLQIVRVAYEPLLLQNHSYYSVSWVRRVIRGHSWLVRGFRSFISLVLRAFFRGLLMLRVQYFPLLKGQSIYIVMRKPG